MTAEHQPSRRARTGCRRGQPRRAFSLIELLIVVAMGVVLYVMLLSPSAKAHQRKMKERCARNLRNTYTALQTYANDFHGAYPIVTNATTSEAPLSLLIPRYTTGSGFFICPGSDDKALPDATPFAGRRISYAFYMGRRAGDGATQPLMSDEQVNSLPKTVGQPLFSADGKKPGRNHHQYGGNVLFADGSIQSSAAKAKFDLPVSGNVILLNPKP